MNQKVVITIAVVLILLGGVLVYILSQPKPSASETTQPATTNSTSNDTSTPSDTPTSTVTVDGITITFTNNGFDKTSYSVKAGNTVTVKNDSDMSVQFSSDDHPTHRENTEMNIKVLAPGESGTFTPTTKGTHGFHDHINDQYTGVLVVE